MDTFGDFMISEAVKKGDEVTQLRERIRTLESACEAARQGIKETIDRICIHCFKAEEFNFEKGVHIFRRPGDRYDGHELPCDAVGLRSLLEQLEGAIKHGGKH